MSTEQQTEKKKILLVIVVFDEHQEKIVVVFVWEKLWRSVECETLTSLWPCLTSTYLMHISYYLLIMMARMIRTIIIAWVIKTIMIAMIIYKENYYDKN